MTSTADNQTQINPHADNPDMRRAVTVYCASSSKIPSIYFEAAHDLGVALAREGLTTVTGGGRAGLMAAVIEAATERRGKTIGVIPRFMVDRRWHHPSLTEMIVTGSMHERKETMAAMSRAAIALPGGCGTFEELLEIITWRQLGLYPGHVIILNIDGYYDPLIAMLDRSVEQHFMNPDHRDLYHVTDSIDRAVEIALSPVIATEFTQKIV